jgi:hypothetical protein
MFKGAHNNICNKSTVYVTVFIYRDPYFGFSDTISYFVGCILVARWKIVLSKRGIGENGMSCVFFQELPMAASTLCKVMFDETIILQISL